jgi:RNA polymerase sigma factor for flagellar operon FliA
VEASLWRRFRLESEAGCREALFNRYVGLARSVAARFFHRRRPPRPDLSDYQQFACQGLLEAIDRFDPLKGVPFEAYSKKRIAGSIADGVARMSEVDAQLSARRRAERERLRSLGRFDNQEEALPALAELAVGLAIGLLLEGTNILAEECAEDPRPNAYESLEYRQLQMRLAECVGSLPEKESAVVRQHYLNGLDFAQIAELMNLSRGRISQLHQSALERLRKKIGTFA